MRNIFYYLEKHGHKSFEELPFNEVDSLILCQLTYMNFDKYISDDFSNVFEIIINHSTDELVDETVNKRKNRKFIEEFKHTTRYKNLKAGYIENHLCYEEIKQLFVMTFLINDFLYIAFRGTDLTLCGWNEDFNMAFLKEIPAQRDSVIYVDKIYEKYKMPMYIGGHSKGGNLAVYSALYSKVDINKYIINVYNFDGPGFNEYIYENEEYLLLKDKIINMTAEEAIVGVLLHYSENQIFVKCAGISVFQHDPYNWIIDDFKFHRIKKNNIQSRWFAKACHEFLLQCNHEERENFINIIFNLLYDDKTTTISNIKKNPIKYLNNVNSRKKELSDYDKVFSKMMLDRFKSSFYKVLKDNIALMKEKIRNKK